MATTTSIQTTRRWNFRTIAYSVLAGLLGLLNVFLGLFIIAPSPWQPINSSTPWLTPWHNAGSAMAVGILGGAMLFSTLWHPQSKAGLFQLFVFITLITAPIIALLRIPYLGFEFSSWVFYGLIAILVILYPAREQLISFKGEAPGSRPLLILTIFVALLLLPDLIRNAQWQITGFGGDPAKRYFWLEMIFLIVTLIAGGALAAIKRSGWQVLGILLGIIFVYFGVVAVTLPNAVGSWGIAGGVLSLLAGAAYILLTLWEIRRNH